MVANNGRDFQNSGENDFPPGSLYTANPSVKCEGRGGKKHCQTCKQSTSLATMVLLVEIPLGYTPTKRRNKPRKKIPGKSGFSSAEL